MRLSRTLPYRKAAAWKPSTLPLCIFTGQRQLVLRKILGFHPTFSRHGIAQILSALGELIWLDEKVASACVVARQSPPPVFRFPISCLIHDGALPPCRRCVVLGRVQRCPRPCATLSSAVINVVHGRGQRAEPVLVTDFPLEAMERRGEEADNSVPSSSFGHLRASKGGGGVSICEIMPIFAVQHFTQCIE